MHNDIYKAKLNDASVIIIEDVTEGGVRRGIIEIDPAGYADEAHPTTVRPSYAKSRLSELLKTAKSPLLNPDADTHDSTQSLHAGSLKLPAAAVTDTNNVVTFCSNERSGLLPSVDEQSGLLPSVDDATRRKWGTGIDDCRGTELDDLLRPSARNKHGDPRTLRRMHEVYAWAIERFRKHDEV